MFYVTGYQPFRAEETTVTHNPRTITKKQIIEYILVTISGNVKNPTSIFTLVKDCPILYTYFVDDISTKEIEQHRVTIAIKGTPDQVATVVELLTRLELAC